jgi:hypothetical protein
MFCCDIARKGILISLLELYLFHSYMAQICSGEECSAPKIARALSPTFLQCSKSLLTQSLFKIIRLLDWILCIFYKYREGKGKRDEAEGERMKRGEERGWGGEGGRGGPFVVGSLVHTNLPSSLGLMSRQG